MKELDVKNESTKVVWKKALVVYSMVGLTGASLIYAEIDVRFASTFGAENQQSDGSPMDTSFTFELGAFEDGFTPTSSNTDSWLANWIAAPNSDSNASGGSSAPYTQVAIGPSTTNRFDGTTRLDGNPPNFTDTDQAFIWGFDDRGEGGGTGAGEWILLTNPGWLYPNDPGPGVNFGPDFLVSDQGTTAVLGEVNPDWADLGDDPHMVTESVLLPVPEPSSALLLMAGCAIICGRRRRTS